MSKTFKDIFKEWIPEDKSLISKEEMELSEDFCTYLDNHFDDKLKELLEAMDGNEGVMDGSDKAHNMAACMLSILDSLKLYDNEQLELGDETLSEVMFRKMRGYNVDLNKELGFTHLKPVTKKK